MKVGEPSAAKSAPGGIGAAGTAGVIRPIALREASMPLRPTSNWPPAATIPAPAATATDPASSVRRGTPAAPPAVEGSLSRPKRWRTTNVPALTISAAKGASTSNEPAVGRDSTATLATTPSTTISTRPGVRERREISPATTATSPITAAMPDSRTTLS